MKKYIQPVLHVVELDTEDMLCLSIQAGYADESEVLSRRKDESFFGGNAPWSDNIEE